jgi:demethylmenaquinone methyltransferase/2-methoxy-6-polyprenyl-1,4-benzoquinol methylase
MLPLDHFAILAPYYDRIFHGRGSFERDIERLVAYVVPEPGHRLLDIGGGTGRIAQYFCDRVAQVCVLDPSSAMLRESRDKCTRAPTLCSMQGESEGLPFADAVFDRIMVIDAFHHLCDQERAAREMIRVLSPGGRLVVQEPDVAHWGVKLVAWGEKALLMRSRFYAPRAIGAIFARNRAVSAVRVEPCSGSASGVTAWVIIDKVQA